MNDCRFFGRLTRDPELRYTQNGTAVADFALAIDDSYVKNGEKVKNTDFLDFTIWNGRAEALTKYAKKGQRLLVSGKAKQDVWEDKNSGEKRSKIRFRVNDFEFVDFGDKPISGGNQEKVDSESVDDEEIPF